MGLAAAGHDVTLAVTTDDDAAKSLCAENDDVVGHFWLHPLSTAAMLHGRPRVVVHFRPLGMRSRHVPPAGPNLGRWLKGLLCDLGDHVFGRQVFSKANALRVREGLPPLKSLQRELFVSGDLTLIAASPALCPRQPDWGGHIRITGYLSTPHPESDALPDDVLAFLDAGEPPVYFSFGSRDAFYEEDNARLFRDALARTIGAALGDPRLSSKAKRLAQALAREDGVRDAVETIGRTFGERVTERSRRMAE